MKNCLCEFRYKTYGLVEYNIYKLTKRSFVKMAEIMGVLVSSGNSIILAAIRDDDLKISKYFHEKGLNFFVKKKQHIDPILHGMVKWSVGKPPSWSKSRLSIWYKEHLEKKKKLRNKQFSQSKIFSPFMQDSLSISSRISVLYCVFFNSFGVETV